MGSCPPWQLAIRGDVPISVAVMSKHKQTDGQEFVNSLRRLLVIIDQVLGSPGGYSE